jgi:hypothetical protein
MLALPPREIDPAHTLAFTRLCPSKKILYWTSFIIEAHQLPGQLFFKLTLLIHQVNDG